MKIGIIGGTGKQGFALAKRLIDMNYEVVIGSRSEERGKLKAAEVNSSLIRGGSNDNAVKADVIVLAIPFNQVRKLLMPLKDHLQGKIIIDMINNLKVGKYSTAVLYEGKSSYELIREWFPDSSVVTMLKTISHTMLQTQELIDQADFQITTSDEAYEFTSKISEAMGMTPVRVRGKVHAHTIERMVALAIQINKEYPGSHVGYQLTSLVTDLI